MTEWRLDKNALRERVAVVAGATRGAGRGIAAALGEAGNQKSVTSGQLASGYGFADVDGSRPDIWRFRDMRERGLEADMKEYR